MKKVKAHLNQIGLRWVGKRYYANPYGSWNHLWRSGSWPIAGAALGAAAGNSVGQFLASGEVDWDQVIKAAATAAVGAYGTTGYAATVGNAVGVTNAAAAQVVGNAIINSSLKRY